MAARWYVIHVHSGSEKKVAQQIEEQAARKGLSEKFERIVIPAEEVVEVRRGKKVNVERKFFPGYILIQMEISDATWVLVKDTPKVTGFLGAKRNKPTPISPKEAEVIIRQMEEGVARPKSSLTFEIGEQVQVCDGPFASFNGFVEEVDEERERLKVGVAIFGRSTPVELEYTQVQKNK